MSHNKEPEHLEQRCLFDWINKHLVRIPELRGAFAVPNGRGRSKMEAGKLKAEGVRAGVLDVWLPVPRDGYHGLVCEMKAPGKLGATSEEQNWWIKFLRDQGYLVLVADHWRSAWNVIIRYLGRPDLCLEIPHLESIYATPRTQKRSRAQSPPPPLDAARGSAPLSSQGSLSRPAAG